MGAVYARLGSSNAYCTSRYSALQGGMNVPNDIRISPLTRCNPSVDEGRPASQVGPALGISGGIGGITRL
jgi:hypothetical protein